MKLKSLINTRSASFLLLTGSLFASAAMAQTAPTVSNDATNVYYSIPYSGTPQFVRIYLDSDHTSSSGYGAQEFGVGADYLFENGALYRYAGSNGSWNWSFVKSVSFTSSGGVAKVRIDRAALGSPTQINLVTQTTPPVQTSAKIVQVLSSTTTTTTTTSPTTTTTTTSPTTTTTSPTTTTTSPTTTTSTTTTTTTAPAC